MKILLFVLLLASLSFCIVAGQQDSPQPKIISCEGHRQLDQVAYNVKIMNDGKVSSNFRIGDRYSKNLKPGEQGTITVFYPLPLGQHTHSANVEVCVGGYLSYERCVSHRCTYTEGPAPEIDTESLFSTGKLEEACLPVFAFLASAGAALAFTRI